jgi:hypothetical protein
VLCPSPRAIFAFNVASIFRRVFFVIMPSVYQTERPFSSLASGPKTGVHLSAQSWPELLNDVKQRGLQIAPEIAVGDGALGFWKALDEVFPGARHRRCWVHKKRECPELSTHNWLATEPGHNPFAYACPARPKAIVTGA